MNSIFSVSKKDDVWCIPETDYFYSQFSTEKNICLKSLIALLSGKALIDLSDGEYIHWLQLDEEALAFIKEHLH